MSQQQQKQQVVKQAERRHLQDLRILIASIAVLFLIGGAVLWILSSQGILQGPLSNVLLIIFTMLGVLIGLFQWLFPVGGAAPLQHIPAAPVSTPTPQVIVHLPPTLTPSQQSSQAPTVEKATYRGIVGVPPPTDPRTIQQRQQTVQAIYTRLLQPGITALALTGIGGVGKSTLVALVYGYAEEQRRQSNGPFMAQALWLHVDSSVTMVDLAGNLFEALGKPLPDFANLSLRNQALALLDALETTENARLIVFDQFENLLDWQTGYALVDRPGVGEQLDQVQRTLLFAFSIYREPVPLEAAQSVIDSQAACSRAQIQSALDTLLAQHLLQTSGEGSYQLHTIVASYAHSYALAGNEQARQQAEKVAHVRAAEYYQRQLTEQSPPREKRQHIRDVEPLIEAIWHDCQAEQWQAANTLMEQEGLFKELREWGGTAILLELYKLLLPPEKWQAERLQAAHIYNNLGVIYRSLGRSERAQTYLEEALKIYEEEGDRVDEGWSFC